MDEARPSDSWSHPLHLWAFPYNARHDDAGIEPKNLKRGHSSSRSHSEGEVRCVLRVLRIFQLAPTALLHHERESGGPAEVRTERSAALKDECTYLRSLCCDLVPASSAHLVGKLCLRAAEEHAVDTSAWTEYAY